MVKVVKFEEALASVPSKSHKRLLLGNGFSQACRKDIFSYGSLLEKADFSDLSPTAKRAFDVLRTTDFEAVIKALSDAAKLVKIYQDSDAALSKGLRSDAKKLKTLLVETISKHHPPSPSDLSKSEFRHSRAFLREFESIYTVNYDLLLYWSLMHEFEDETPAQRIESDDGFRHPDGDGDGATYVTWEIENSNPQNVYYLHGALHLFTSDTELKKFTWSRTGVKLMTQINAALDNEMYPMIVAEGTSEQKMARIMKSGYLQRGLKSLTSISGALFVYGLSFSENDSHILRRIEKSKLSELWVSLYGDPESKANKKLIASAKSLATGRSSKRSLSLGFFDAASAKVWG